MDFNYHWETFPPTSSQKDAATGFFSRRNTTPKFIRSIAVFRAFPDSDVPEVAFVGRSNVGKSSLLNALVDSNLLARTSSTRGFTKTMNMYGIAPKIGVGINITKTPEGHEKITGPGGLVIVDMPGYGDSSLSEWGTEIMKYLQNRKQLRRVFVLIDAAHGLKGKDKDLLASLRSAGISHQIVLSKLDKIYLPRSAATYKSAKGKMLSKLQARGSVEELRSTMEGIKAKIQPERAAGALGELLGCSSEILVNGRRLGVEAVRFAVLQAAGIRVGRKSSKGEQFVMDGTPAGDEKVVVDTATPRKNEEVEEEKSSSQPTQSMEPPTLTQPSVKSYVNMPIQIQPSPSPQPKPRATDAGEELLLENISSERIGRRRIARPRRRLENASEDLGGSELLPSSQPSRVEGVGDEGERLLMASVEPDQGRGGGRRR